MNSTDISPSAIQADPRNYIAMDVHSNNVVVCVKRNIINAKGCLVGQTIAEKTIATKGSYSGLTQFLARYADSQQHTMVAESTFNWYWIANIAEERGWNMRLADPSTVSQASIKAANDRTDADYLAERLRTNSLKTATIMPRKQRAARDLMRHRLNVMHEVAEKKIRLSNLCHNHLGHPLHGKELQGLQLAFKTEGMAAIYKMGFDTSGSEFIIADLLLGLKQAQERLKHLEEQVFQIIDSNVEFQSSRALLLRTIKGCGNILSSILVTEIGDINRFHSMGDFVSYCRLAPTSKLSNGKSKGKGNAKNGNAYLSWALTELATLMARFNRPVQRYLDRKLERRGLRVVAIRSLAAKLARCVYQLLRKNEPFDLFRAFGAAAEPLVPQPAQTEDAVEVKEPKRVKSVRRSKAKTAAVDTAALLAPKQLSPGVA